MTKTVIARRLAYQAWSDGTRRPFAQPVVTGAFTPNRPHLANYYPQPGVWANSANWARFAQCSSVIFTHYNGAQAVGGRTLRSTIDGIKALVPASLGANPVHSAYIVHDEVFDAGSGDSATARLRTKLVAENWYLRTSFPGGAIVESSFATNLDLINRTSTGQVADANGKTWITWMADLMVTMNVTGEPGNAANPSLDAMFLDNCYVKPRKDGDYNRDGALDSNNDAAFATAERTGIKAHFDYMRAAWPGARFELGNLSDWPLALGGSLYSSTFTPSYAGIAPLRNVIDGGLAGEYFLSDASEPFSYEWQERANGLTGFYAARNQLQFMDGAVTTPCLNIWSIRDVVNDNSAADNQRRRFGAAFVTTCSDGAIDDRQLLNYATLPLIYTNGTGVGWLGQPLETSRYSGNAQGVYIREFANGYTAVNPRNNGARTFTLPVTVRDVETGTVYSAGALIPIADRDGGFYVKGAPAPTWTGTPTPSFTLGIASSYSLASLITGTGYTLSSIGTALPGGVTINNTTKALDYDGGGSGAFVSGVILRATSAGGSADSVAFSISISAAVADWLARSTTPGVVWAHNFESANEVNAFRHVGGFNDPGNTGSSTVQWLSSDGFAGGGCVEITTPSSGISAGGWWRPMAAIAAGTNANGKAAADNAANGTVKLRPWNAANTGENFNFRQGYYAHPSVVAANTTWLGTSDPFDGTEFWFQFRVKIQNTRWQGYNGPASAPLDADRNPPGKLMFIDVTASTHESEIVVYSGGPDPVYFNSTYPFRMYTASGSSANSFLTSPQGAGTGSTMQGGGPYATTCLIGSDTTGVNACWEWPRAAEWITVLIHVIPGRDNFADRASPLASWTNKDTAVEAWVARANDTEYTKVFEDYALAWLFGDRDGDGTPYELHPAAFNSVCPSAYMNNVPALAGAGWYQRYTQLIFSKDYVRPPGQLAPTWWTA